MQNPPKTQAKSQGLNQTEQLQEFMKTTFPSLHVAGQYEVMDWQKLSGKIIGLKKIFTLFLQPNFYLSGMQDGKDTYLFLGHKNELGGLDNLSFKILRINTQDFKPAFGQPGGKLYQKWEGVRPIKAVLKAEGTKSYQKIAAADPQSKEPLFALSFHKAGMTTKEGKTQRQQIIRSAVEFHTQTMEAAQRIQEAEELRKSAQKPKAGGRVKVI